MLNYKKNLTQIRFDAKRIIHLPRFGRAAKFFFTTFLTFFMRKLLQCWLGVLLLVTAFGQKTQAQATFALNNPPGGSAGTYNFQVGNGSVSGNPLTVTTGNTAVSYSVYVYKPVGDNTTDGNVEIYAGDNNAQLASTPISQNYLTNVNWFPLNSSQQYANALGYCNATPSSLTGFTKVYAVFTNRSNNTRVISPGIDLVFPVGPVGPVAAPTVTTLSPNSGSVGTSVTINGTNFNGATTVRFNGVVATFTTSSSTSITATVPQGATSGNVTVTNSAGTSTGSVIFTVSQAVLVAPVTGPQPGVNYLIRNRNSGQMLEIGGVFPTPRLVGALANQWPSTGGLNQQWTISYIGQTHCIQSAYQNNICNGYKITNALSSYCLDLFYNSIVDAYPNGVPIAQDLYTGNTTQKWAFEPIPGFARGYSIRNVETFRYLEIEGGDPASRSPGRNADQWESTGNREQQWELIPVPAVTGGAQFPGVYTITNVNSGKILDMPSFSTTVGQQATQYSSVGTDNQHWVIQEVSSLNSIDIAAQIPVTRPRVFKITNRHSGMALGVDGNILAPGYPVVQRPYNKFSALTNRYYQEWTIEEVVANSGRYRIMNSVSNMALAVVGGSPSDGARIHQWPYYVGANHELWYIRQFALNRPKQSPTVSIYPRPADTFVAVTMTVEPDGGDADIVPEPNFSQDADDNPELWAATNINEDKDVVNYPDDNPETVDEPADKSAAHVWFYDYTGIVKKEIVFGDDDGVADISYVKPEEGITKVDTTEWPEGIYYVRVLAGGKVTSYQLPIQHK